MREVIDPWSFVYAAYALGIGATALMIGWSWLAMRRAETRRDQSRGK
jgi:hypothetical protein